LNFGPFALEKTSREVMPTLGPCGFQEGTKIVCKIVSQAQNTNSTTQTKQETLKTTNGNLRN